MRRLGPLLAIALAWWSMPAAAGAHGPCNCSFPQVGEPGVTVRSRTPAYRIVFNPRPRDFVYAMDRTGYASAYRPSAPTRTVLERPVGDPARPATFRVPEVPPGVYLVLIYDGSEGGSHSTWDYFHVLGPAPGHGVPLFLFLWLWRAALP